MLWAIVLFQYRRYWSRLGGYLMERWKRVWLDRASWRRNTLASC